MRLATHVRTWTQEMLLGARACRGPGRTILCQQTLDAMVARRLTHQPPVGAPLWSHQAAAKQADARTAHLIELQESLQRLERSHSAVSARVNVLCDQSVRQNKPWRIMGKFAAMGFVGGLTGCVGGFAAACASSCLVRT